LDYLEDNSGNIALEECDDANLYWYDECRNDCKLNFCGDGYLYFGVEECDDGDVMVNDGCDNLCNLENAGMWCFEDIDNDGYGNMYGGIVVSPDEDCEDDGESTVATDCHDEDATVNPGANEVCGDEEDNNCDGQIDEGC
jgi:cysteine-rich repeat protein